MESPFRSEAAAFRFLLITIGAFALIVAASWINPWLGTAVTLALAAAAIVVYMRQRGPQAPQQRVEHVGAPDERRVLVVANETVAGAELMQAIGDLALAEKTEFFVVCPALNSRLRTWTSDEDGARAEAQKRLDASLGAPRLGRDRGAGIGRRPRPARRDRGRRADVPPGRDRALDASARALALARAWGREGGHATATTSV